MAFILLVISADRLPRKVTNHWSMFETFTKPLVIGHCLKLSQSIDNSLLKSLWHTVAVLSELECGACLCSRRLCIWQFPGDYAFGNFQEIMHLAICVAWSASTQEHTGHSVHLCAMSSHITVHCQHALLFADAQETFQAHNQHDMLFASLKLGIVYTPWVALLPTHTGLYTKYK